MGLTAAPTIYASTQSLLLLVFIAAYTCNNNSNSNTTDQYWNFLLARVGMQDHPHIYENRHFLRTAVSCSGGCWGALHRGVYITRRRPFCKMAATAVSGQICDGQMSRNICNILVYMSAKFGAFIAKCTILWIFELCCPASVSRHILTNGYYWSPPVTSSVCTYRAGLKYQKQKVLNSPDLVYFFSEIS